MQAARYPDPPDPRDQLLTCVWCGAEFVWTIGQQQFYADRGLRPPKRCKACRVAKRTAHQHDAQELDQLTCRHVVDTLRVHRDAERADELSHR